MGANATSTRPRQGAVQRPKIVNRGRSTEDEVDFVAGGRDQRHGQTAVEIGGSRVVDLEDAIQRPQEAGSGRRVGRAAFSNPIGVDAFLVKAVGKAEAEILVDFVLQ